MHRMTHKKPFRKVFTFLLAASGEGRARRRMDMDMGMEKHKFLARNNHPSEAEYSDEEEKYSPGDGICPLIISI